MRQILIDNPLLLLFLVAAVGNAVGRIRIGGFSLGVAAVLFTGLAIGSLDPGFKLPDFVYLFGLVLFIYPVALSSGQAFFASFRQRGLRHNAFILAMLLWAACATLIAQRLFHLTGATTGGLFAGSLTNTPALAAVLEELKAMVAGTPGADSVLAEPVVAYSLTYPAGVVAMILVIYFAQRIRPVDFRAEARAVDPDLSGDHLTSRTVLVTRVRILGSTVDQLMARYRWRVQLARIKRGDEVGLIHGDIRLAIGDIVTLVGPEGEVDRAVNDLGVRAEEELDWDRREYDFRRIFVSEPRVAGKKLSQLDIRGQFGAVITRVRRGDVDLLPHPGMVLELGDRVRVVAPREQMGALADYFGDSYRALSEIDILTFGVGAALGLFAGILPLPLPNGDSFRLGFAGGPLVVGLILGALGRTGPIVWQVPYSANLTLRQIGLILFLAGIGVRSGYAFGSVAASAKALAVIGAGAFVTVTTAVLTLWVGRALMHIPRSYLTGMLAALQTQPAVLAYASEQSQDEVPNLGWALIYPLAMIVKILLAQLLATLH